MAKKKKEDEEQTMTYRTLDGKLMIEQQKTPQTKPHIKWTRVLWKGNSCSTSGYSFIILEYNLVADMHTYEITKLLKTHVVISKQIKHIL